MNSLLVERTYCWSDRAEGEEEGVVCFGQGPLPQVMSSMFYLNAESGKEVSSLGHFFCFGEAFCSGLERNKISVG